LTPPICTAGVFLETLNIQIPLLELGVVALVGARAAVGAEVPQHLEDDFMFLRVYCCLFVCH
jgi:hypothetical protein